MAKIIKLTKKSEYNYIVTVPKEFIDKYGWKAKQKLVFSDQGRGRLELRDWRKK